MRNGALDFFITVVTILQTSSAFVSGKHGIGLFDELLPFLEIALLWLGSLIQAIRDNDENACGKPFTWIWVSVEWLKMAGLLGDFSKPIVLPVERKTSWCVRFVYSLASMNQLLWPGWTPPTGSQELIEYQCWVYTSFGGISCVYIYIYIKRGREVFFKTYIYIFRSIHCINMWYQYETKC